MEIVFGKFKKTNCLTFYLCHFQPWILQTVREISAMKPTAEMKENPRKSNLIDSWDSDWKCCLFRFEFRWNYFKLFEWNGVLLTFWWFNFFLSLNFEIFDFRFQWRPFLSSRLSGNHNRFACFEKFIYLVVTIHSWCHCLVNWYLLNHHKNADK